MQARLGSIVDPDSAPDVVLPPPAARFRGESPTPASAPRPSPHRLAIAASSSDIVDAEIVGDDEPDEEEARLDRELAQLRRMRA
jgi:hypothetical protein